MLLDKLVDTGGWRSKKTNTKVKITEKLIIENELCLLNQGAPTHIDASNGNLSAVYLAVFDPVICLDFTWSVYNDTRR